MWNLRNLFIAFLWTWALSEDYFSLLTIYPERETCWYTCNFLDKPRTHVNANNNLRASENAHLRLYSFMTYCHERLHNCWNYYWSRRKYWYKKDVIVKWSVYISLSRWQNDWFLLHYINPGIIFIFYTKIKFIKTKYIETEN